MKIHSRKHSRQSGSILMTTLVILGITGFLMITYPRRLAGVVIERGRR